MTHYQALLYAIEQHGRITYRELIDCYGQRGYTYSGFVQAAYRGRRRGAVQGPNEAGYLTYVDNCPCCGRPFAT